MLSGSLLATEQCLWSLPPELENSSTQHRRLTSAPWKTHADVGSSPRSVCSPKPQSRHPSCQVCTRSPHLARRLPLKHSSPRGLANTAQAPGESQLRPNQLHTPSSHPPHTPIPCLHFPLPPHIPISHPHLTRPAHPQHRLLAHAPSLFSFFLLLPGVCGECLLLNIYQPHCLYPTS